MPQRRERGSIFLMAGVSLARPSAGEIAEQAEALARPSQVSILPRGSRVGIVAETHPDFHIAFFAARRAALVPVPLPASIHMGGTASFIELLGRLLRHADAKVALATEAFLPYLRDAAAADTQIPVQTIAAFAGRSPSAPPRPR